MRRKHPEKMRGVLAQKRPRGKKMPQKPSGHYPPFENVEGNLERKREKGEFPNPKEAQKKKAKTT